MKRIAHFILLVAMLAPVVSTTACATSTTHDVKMAPMNMLPAQMQNAPTRVREAYQFAVANPEALKNVPCYCGCGAIGHTSNYSCYFNETDKVFDQHALGCSVCVDIAQDVMKMTREGRAPPEIRAAIVATYSQFGPANQE